METPGGVRGVPGAGEVARGADPVLGAVPVGAVVGVEPLGGPVLPGVVAGGVPPPAGVGEGVLGVQGGAGRGEAPRRSWGIG